MDDRVQFGSGAQEANPKVERHGWTVFPLDQIHLHIGDGHIVPCEAFIVQPAGSDDNISRLRISGTDRSSSHPYEVVFWQKESRLENVSTQFFEDHGFSGYFPSSCPASKKASMFSSGISLLKLCAGARM